MKRTLKYFSLIILGTIGQLGSMAQDIHFSQFFEAPLLRNPSLAGIFTGDVRVQAIYRDQWNSVTNAYKTGSLNGEYKMPVGKADDFLTLGMQILYDKAGTVAWTSAHVLPTVNFHKSLSDEVNRYLSLGFMAGVVQRGLDRSRMTTNSTYDGMGDGENLAANQYIYADGAVGLSFNTQLNDNEQNNLYLGVAYHHFNRPKTTFYSSGNIELQPKIVGSAGIRFGVTPASYLTIMGDYSTQGDYREAIAGALYGLKVGGTLEQPQYTLHGGAFMRLNDAFIPVVKLDYHPFSVSFSYDVNISQLKTSSRGRGGFELGISYIGFTNRDNSVINATLCPRF
jgi:type IX secretion system PorP/SprF family membrane protein